MNLDMVPNSSISLDFLMALGSSAGHSDQHVHLWQHKNSDTHMDADGSLDPGHPLGF